MKLGTVRLKRLHSVKSRPNLGRAAFNTYCDLRGVGKEDRKEEYTATDLIVDVLQFAQRKGWDPELILDSVRMHLDAETVEPCRKCGKGVIREDCYTDKGEGKEMGNVFYYCSEACRNLH